MYVLSNKKLWLFIFKADQTNSIYLTNLTVCGSIPDEVVSIYRYVSSKSYVIRKYNVCYCYYSISLAPSNHTGARITYEGRITSGN